MTPRIVVIGGGYAGTAVARALGRRAQVTIITEDNSLLFTPMLAEVAAGALDPRHIVTPVRQLAPYANVIQGKAERIDVARKLVTVVPRFGLPRVEVEGDALVLALGSVPNTFGVRGVDQHANFFKTIGDALRIRNRLLALLEAASQQRLGHLTTVAVVGAGNSGVELAGALADFLGRAAARFFPQAPRPKVLLVDFVDRVTPSLPERVSAAAERALRGRNVELVLGRRVLEVEESGVLLEDGHQIKAATIVWTGGVKPNPIVAELGLTLDRGKVVVDDHLQAAPGVFALGDLAAVPDGAGGYSPSTAQHALRQGGYLGRNLPGLLSGEGAPAFAYRSKGELVSIGFHNAVGTVWGLPVSGPLAWFLWRSYYLLKLPSPLRKARVALDWTLDLVFPPDVAWIASSDLGPDPTLG